MHILQNNLHIKLFLLCLTYTLHLADARPQDIEDLLQTLRTGRYVPQVHGADRGRYVPDESGRYHHVNIPYDGGYGDRGVAYVHIEPTRGPTGLGGLSLGPKDHLRFSVDFNFNNNGWQIVQLEYLNDDDEKKNYDYKYERQLWPVEAVENTVDDAAANYAKSAPKPPAATPTTLKIKSQTTAPEAISQPEQTSPASVNKTPSQTPSTNVRVSGEYQDDIYNVSYTNDNKSNATSANVQAVIGVVLDYIQKNVLPTLS